MLISMHIGNSVRLSFCHADSNWLNILLNSFEQGHFYLIDQVDVYVSYVKLTFSHCYAVLSWKLYELLWNANRKSYVVYKIVPLLTCIL